MKIVYASYRKAEIGREKFVRRWRYHGALAMLMPSFFGPVVRYVQNDPVPDIERIAGAIRYDAVGELHYENAEGLMRSLTAPETVETITPDGDEFFDRSEPSNALIGAFEDEMLIDGEAGAFAIFLFLTASPGSRSSLDRWEAISREFVAQPEIRELISTAALGRAADLEVELSPVPSLLHLTVNGRAATGRIYADWRAFLESNGRGEIMEDDVLCTLCSCCSLYDLDAI